MTEHRNCAVFIRERGSYAFTDGKKQHLIGDNFAAHLLTLSPYLFLGSEVSGPGFFPPSYETSLRTLL